MSKPFYSMIGLISGFSLVKLGVFERPDSPPSTFYLAVSVFQVSFHLLGSAANPCSLFATGFPLKGL